MSTSSSGDPEQYKEVLYTINKDGSRKWVYAAFIDGFFRQRRRITAWVLMAFYLSMPWLTFGGKQAILLDLYRRKFIFFGHTFWATDTLYLVMILGVLALSLFFFTALFGRLWCGWACPETVFLEFLFRPIERFFEGSHTERMRLDQAPWTPKKIYKKGMKHAISALIAWFIASTFLAYFVGSDALISMIQLPPWENPFLFGVTVFLMAAMGFQFGWFREQFCTLVCPYARFQSVLLDTHSVIVGYDAERGEPRRKVDRNSSDQGYCINCKKCVAVCPTGIDIRNGLQLECINCTACMDACDSVMDKLSWPKGLIRYDSEEGFAGKKTKYFRPRVLVYAAIICIFFVSLVVGLSDRKLSEFQIVRGGLDAPYSKLTSGRITNHLHMRLSNKSEVQRAYRLELAEPVETVKLTIPFSPFPVSPEQMLTVPLFVEFDPAILVEGKKKISIEVFDDQEQSLGVQTVTLLGPGV